MTSDPLLLFRAAADALRQGDWRSVADLCDPASLLEFHRQQIEIHAPAEPRPELTLDRLMSSDPDMPREVAEYQFSQFQKHHDRNAQLERELPGVGSAEALRTMSPADVFASWLRGRSTRHQVERLVRDGEVPEWAREEVLRTAVRPFRFVALGAVPDGDSVVHVVFREEIEGSSEDLFAEDAWFRSLPAEVQVLSRDLSGRVPPQVTSCRRQPDGEWRLLAGSDFLGLGQFVVSFGYDEAD